MENPTTSNRDENRCPLFVALNFVEVFGFFALFLGFFFCEMENKCISEAFW